LRALLRQFPSIVPTTINIQASLGMPSILKFGMEPQASDGVSMQGGISVISRRWS
jgi:hypothetical protein